MARDIPIIFSAPMVRALIAGRKTMTRRMARTERKIPGPGSLGGDSDRIERPSPWQKVNAGDRLWVRENLQFFGEPGGLASLMHEPLHWAADEREPGRVGPAIPVPDDWRLPKHGGERIPSIHMPRWASRLTLVVTETKIEPLQNLTDYDAIAEGVAPLENSGGPNFFTIDMGGGSLNQPTAAGTFALLWKILHGEASWDANPHVVALTFKVIRTNIDAPEALAA